jgi:hypothetical protein
MNLRIFSVCIHKKLEGVNTAGMLLTSRFKLGGQTSGLTGSEQIGTVGSIRPEYASKCHRKIFAERLGEELQPYARRTNRLNQHLNAIGFALGGNAGSKLACFIGMPVSSSTLLRVILNTDDEPVNTPSVLGVDDFAFRKGNTYGTILVDLEKNKPIDLLPDREGATLEKWLKDHPGVEIISRDRAGSYAQGAKAGAPDAIQVADRWHLLKNLGDALKRMLDQHNRELRLAAEDVAKAERKKELQDKKRDQKQNTSVEKSCCCH